MRRAAARTLIPLLLAGILAGPAAGIRRQPHVKPKAAISPIRWALQSLNFVETRSQGVLGHAAGVCMRAQATQRPEDWQKVEAETRTLRDYLLAADPARMNLIVQSRAASRLLRPFVLRARRAHLAQAKAQFLGAAMEYGASFAAVRDGATALEARNCTDAKDAFTDSAMSEVAGQDEARQGLIELRSAGFAFVSPDWAYE